MLLFIYLFVYNCLLLHNINVFVCLAGRVCDRPLTDRVLFSTYIIKSGIDGGEISNHTVPLRSTIHYSCDGGHFLQNGSTTIICDVIDGKDADWIGQFPSCPGNCHE